VTPVPTHAVEPVPDRDRDHDHDPDHDPDHDHDHDHDREVRPDSPALACLRRSASDPA
jgi:hypothetical protein